MMRRRTYSVISVTLLALAVLVTVLLVVYGAYTIANAVRSLQIAFGCVFGAAAICFFLLPPDVLAHECGHMACGALTGMRFPVVRIGRLEFSKTGVRYRLRIGAAGETAIVPRGANRMRLRVFVTALGGPLFSVAYGVTMLALFWLYPAAPAIFFFVLFAPLSLYNGIVALLPAELDGSRTDGAVMRGIIRQDAETDVTFRVLQVQGILTKGTYADVPRELLFGAPVVREDCRAFAALLFLQYEYAKFHGDAAGAAAALSRLRSIEDYLTDEERKFLANEKDPAVAGS